MANKESWPLGQIRLYCNQKSTQEPAKATYYNNQLKRKQTANVRTKCYPPEIKTQLQKRIKDKTKPPKTN
jgi:hypothetical protein